MPLHLKRGLPFELLQVKRNFFFLALLIKLTICDIFIIIFFFYRPTHPMPIVTQILPSQVTQPRR